MTPAAMIHALAGAAGLGFGAAALIARKGGAAHIFAGRGFAISMSTTGVSGAVLGAMIGEIGNFVAGAAAFYLVATAWLAARRRDGETGWPDWAALGFSASAAALSFYFTYRDVQAGTALLGGVPGYGFSIVMTIAAALDLSVILRRGLSGKARIKRHLWRMCAGFFISVGSFFPGQIQFFPEAVQGIRPIILLFIPAFSVIAVMLYWLARVSLERTGAPSGVRS